MKTTSDASLYRTDYSAWISEQVESLQRGDLEALDVPNLIDEVRSLGVSERNALESNLTVVIEHILKLSLSSLTEPRAGWTNPVREHARRIVKILQQSPSLRRELNESIMSAYRAARARVEDEYGTTVTENPDEALVGEVNAALAVARKQLGLRD